MKRILFICEANSIRSQLAEGLARYYWLGRNVQIESAGCFGGGSVDMYVKKVLLEMKIDYSMQFSKSYTAIENPEGVNAVVILCGRDFIGNYFPNAKKYHLPLAIPRLALGCNNRQILDSYRFLSLKILELLKTIKL